MQIQDSEDTGKKIEKNVLNIFFYMKVLSMRKQKKTLKPQQNKISGKARNGRDNMRSQYSVGLGALSPFLGSHEGKAAR
jgi:hypothetical protein